MKRSHVLVLCMVVYGGVLTAQTGTLWFGMNLSEFSDYGAEYPTLDIMKSSREWFSHNAGWVEGGKNSWDTELADRFDLTADGWPAADIPRTIAGTEDRQVLSTVWANAKALGTAVHVATWTGDADIVFDMGARVEVTKPGEVRFRIDPAAEVLRLTITRNSSRNPLRDLKVRPLTAAGTVPTAVWNPDWLEKLKPFKTLRFMDWGRTNWSPLVRWEDRGLPGDRTWTGPSGAPYEAMIDLANTLGSDLWVCIPHQADTAYIRQMARLFRDNLRPGLKLYVEFSNETWNWMFSQTHWLKDRGNQSVEWPERIVPFIQTALDIWSEEWKTRRPDLVRVVAVQTGWLDVAQRVARTMRSGSFDALAGTFYIGFSEQSTKELAALGTKAAAADVLRLAAADRDRVEWPRVRALSELAQSLGVPLVFYEGGQHLTPDPFGSEQPYNPALEAAQTDPGMYRLYKDWFALLKTLPQARNPTGLLAMHFSLAAPLSGRYGSWGALTDIAVKPPYLRTAPKYQALLEP